MIAKYTANKINYTLVILPESLRESMERAERVSRNIKPDVSLIREKDKGDGPANQYTSKRKRGKGIAL